MLGTVALKNKLIKISEATGVHVALRARTSGPHAGRRVLSLTATAELDEDLVEVAAEMAHVIILRGFFFEMSCCRSVGEPHLHLPGGRATPPPFNDTLPVGGRATPAPIPLPHP